MDIILSEKTVLFFFFPPPKMGMGKLSLLQVYLSLIIVICLGSYQNPD